MTTVSDTARWVAVYRAMESARTDALFQDPFAECLAGAKGKEMAANAQRLAQNGWPVVARTVVIDALILSSVASGCDCVINLAAGLDTRPYRLELPAPLVWIEADLPGIIEEKERLLAGSEPRCRLVRETADLADETARRSLLDRALAGRHKALIITEGLLMYLREETVRSLAHDLDRRDVAWWVFDILSPPIRGSIMKRMQAELANAPVIFAPANGVAFLKPWIGKCRACTRFFTKQAACIGCLGF